MIWGPPAGGTGDATLTGPDTADIVLTDTTTNASSTVLTITHRTTGTPATGLGDEILFKIEDSANNDQSMAAVRVVATDVTDGSEDAEIRLAPVVAGTIAAAGSEPVKITGSGIAINTGTDTLNNRFTIKSGAIEFTGSETFAGAGSGGIYGNASTINIAASGVNCARFTTSGAGASVWYGSSVSGGSITVGSTSHATKGKVYLGSAQTSYFDEANNVFRLVSAGKVELGGATTYILGVSGVAIDMFANGTRALYTDGSYIQTLTPHYIGASGAGTLYAGVVTPDTGSALLQLGAAGKNVAIGAAAILTTATDGFLYVPSCAGAPTGVPTAVTGRCPIVVDSTNHKLYFYDGTWRDAGP
jgi:hypothetical protein